MNRDAHGDPRRPDGDMVSGVAPMDRRVDPSPAEFGPKVGWGHDAVLRPPPVDPDESGDELHAAVDDDYPESDGEAGSAETASAPERPEAG